MTDRIHRGWTITTHATEQGFTFDCRREQEQSKAYGYYPTPEEAILAAMIWVDQGLTDDLI